MGRRVVALVVVALAAPARAEPPIALNVQLETGWTSNATDSAGGVADFYTTHTHEAWLSGETDTFALRGSLAVSQTRFLQTTFENDDAVSGTVEAEVALGENAVLRLGYALSRRWTGDDLMIGGLIVPIHGEETEHELAGALVVAGAGQEVTIGVDAGVTVPAEATLVGLGLPAVRLEPEVGLVSVRVGWEKALSPTVAALADMAAWFTSVPEADQLLFLRAPADGGRVAAGLRSEQGVVTLQGSGGIDLVWPRDWPELMEMSPHYAVSATVTPRADLTLAIGIQAGVELAEPLDGVAGRTASVEGGLAWAAMPDLTISAKLSGWQETGLFDPSLMRSRRTASLGANYAASKQLSYGVTLSWSQHDNPGESYDKAGLALSVSGAL